MIRSHIDAERVRRALSAQLSGSARRIRTVLVKSPPIITSKPIDICSSSGSYLVVFGADFTELKGGAHLDVELELLGVHLYVALRDLVEQMVEVWIAILTARVQVTSSGERETIAIISRTRTRIVRVHLLYGTR